MKVLLVLFLLSFSAYSCRSCNDMQESCERAICMPGNCLYNGKCVQVVGNVCTKNSDCLSNICLVSPSMDYGYCSYTCTQNYDCPHRYICSESPAVCVFAGDEDVCSEDHQCGLCGHCVNNKCSDVYGCPYSMFICSTIADCPYCMNCISNQCVPIEGCRGSMCATNKDCGGCAVCVNGLCKNPEGCSSPPCKSDNECPNGFRCLTTTGECKRRGMSEIGKHCSPDADAGSLDLGDDLGDDMICESGLCIYDDGIYYCTVDCTADNSICPANYNCSIYSEGMRVCKKKRDVYTGRHCRNDSDCDSSKREICMFIADSSSTASAYCSPEFADGLDIGYNCEQNGDCKTNLCPRNKICSKPCAKDKDCPRGYVCEDLLFDINGNELLLKGCVARYYTYGRIGDICNENLPCRDGLFCPSDDIMRPSPICTKECNDSSECIDNYECRMDDLYATGKNLCLPLLEERDCVLDSDCPKGKSCALYVNQERDYHIGCVESIEGNDPLMTCSFATGSPACKNGMCTNYNYCNKFCHNTADCLADYLRCDYLPLKHRDGTFKFTTSCRLRNGSLRPCTTDDDCSDGEVCRRFVSLDGTFEKNACMMPIPAGLPYNSSCNPQILEPKCATDLCSDDAICTRFCTTDAQCGSDMKCDVTHSRLSTGEDLYFMGCRPNKKRGQLGDPCPSGWLDCDYSLFCYNDGERSFCTKSCDIHNPVDCAPPDNICSEVNQNNICVPK